MWDNKDKYNHYLEEDIYVSRGRGMNSIAVAESSDWEDGLRINVKKVIG
jgi:hypothetical protein